MTVGEDLFALLSANTGVTDLVSTRIHPHRMPQEGTVPAIVYTVVSDVEINTLDGRSGLHNALIQIDCYARRYRDAQAVSEAVREVLGSFRIRGLSGQKAGIVRARRETFEDQTEFYRVSLDVSFWTAE